MRAGEANDVVDGEEVGCVVQLGDKFEFVIERLAYLGGRVAGITFARPFLGITNQRFLRGCKAFARFVGIFVFQFCE